MRLIDADTLMDTLGIKTECEDCQFKGFRCTKGSDFVVACEAITDAQTIDAVPVVRCKDCVFHRLGFCRFWQEDITESDFCSYGERRTE